MAAPENPDTQRATAFLKDGMARLMSFRDAFGIRRSANMNSRNGLMIALVMLSTSVGCSGRVYSARSLPAEFQVAKAENAQTVDLSKLATHSMSNELIDCGDVLDVVIDAGDDTDKVEKMPVRVNDDGIANIPIVGAVTLAGVELPMAEQLIATAAMERGVFRSPSVTLMMSQRRTNKITVIGAVEKPGVYKLPRGESTLLAAIVAADGLAKEAGTEVEIRRPARATTPGSTAPNQDRVARGAQLTSYSPERPGPAPAQVVSKPVSYKINLVTAAKQGDGGQPLDDGDVVMVERRDPQPVHVIGLVMKPGQIELPVNQDMHLLDIIAMSGGLSLNVADKIHVLRKVPGDEQPVVIKVSYRDAKSGGPGNLRLAPGDVVSVEETPITVVMDTIRTFFRVGFGAALPGL